jgi:filamentous hemagglutinin
MGNGDRSFPPELDQAKQAKHTPGSKSYIPGRSILRHGDPQRLLDRHAGTGQPVNNVPIGLPGSKERVDFGTIIGEYIDPESGRPAATSRGIIVYDRRGHAHIIPARPSR